MRFVPRKAHRRTAGTRDERLLSGKVERLANGGCWRDAARPLYGKATLEAAGAGSRVEPCLIGKACEVLWSFAHAIACDQVISRLKAAEELG